jgi:hypothetical protein
MATQNYNNHIRYYPPHHFIFYPLLLLLIGLSTYFIFKREDSLIWIFVTAALVMIGYVSFMLRQHYALGNQNRIVRLEMRLRYFVLTNEQFESVEQRISFGQIAALRFAPDKELPGLVERTIKENLTPNEIKISIVNWLPDEMRL